MVAVAYLVPKNDSLRDCILLNDVQLLRVLLAFSPFLSEVDTRADHDNAVAGISRMTRDATEVDGIDVGIAVAKNRMIKGINEIRAQLEVDLLANADTFDEVDIELVRTRPSTTILW